MTDRNMDMAVKLANEVQKAGGRAYFVGGFVRDALMGRENKDIDIEVHGIDYATLSAVLDSIGEKTVMGASFGIFGLKHYDLDIAMPRTEKARGSGHKDFEIYTDPFIGPEKAAMRRDFTINAMMQDVLTGEILDFFHGREDLQAGILRHVNDASFGEDPLRVLRAAQFAARFEFGVAPETAELCSCMDLTALSKERVMAETEKAMLKARRPSVFFETLRQMGQLWYWFPEAERLTGVPQDPKYHPEGDAWVHTMLVVDEAAELRNQAKNPAGLMFAALCHDLGKADTTEQVGERIHAINHEKVGKVLAEKLMSRLSNENELRKYVLNMVELHMRPNILVDQHSGQKSFMRVFDLSVCPEDLILISRADQAGQRLGIDYDAKESVLREKLADYRALMEKPQVTGADLVTAGCKPGKDFSEALDYAHKLHLSGVEKDIALKQTLAYLRKSRETR